MSQQGAVGENWHGNFNKIGQRIRLGTYTALYLPCPGRILIPRAISSLSTPNRFPAGEVERDVVCRLWRRDDTPIDAIGTVVAIAKVRDGGSGHRDRGRADFPGGEGSAAGIGRGAQRSKLTAGIGICLAFGGALEHGGGGTAGAIESCPEDSRGNLRHDGRQRQEGRSRSVVLRSWRQGWR